MQRQEGLWIQGVNSIVPQRRVFRVCASKLASDESLGYQHMGAVYHRVRNRIASTSESHGGDLIIQRYDRSGWRVVLLKCSHSLKGARQPSNFAFSTTKRMGEIEYPSSFTYPAEELCISSRYAYAHRSVRYGEPCFSILMACLEASSMVLG
ncbi:hypothetical protein BHM03_00038617 [Ensete ventricosum]|nr:hypothetical protein BHM03_00038617 [Ensete ventricosum]